MRGTGGRSPRYPGIALALALAAGAVLALRPGEDPPPGRLLVYTEVVAPEPGSEPDWRFPADSRIVALDLSTPDAEPRVLTPGFAAARAPDIHFDGGRLVFAGQREGGGPWQIWELDLTTGEARLVVPACERCTDPVYRADDGVAFVAPAGAAGGPLALYTVGPDGDPPDRITHHPVSDADLGLVWDGRVVVATGAGSPDEPATAYYALRHDGTGAELMYRPEPGGVLRGRIREVGDREMVFVEQPPAASPVVVSVSEAYPGSSRRVLFAPAEGRLHSVFPEADGSLVLSYRRDGSRFALWTRGPDGGAPEPLLAPDGVHAIEPVLATPRPRPLGFVSPTDPTARSGIVYGMDARLTGLGRVDPEAAVLRVRTPAGELGRVPLAEDGSYHIELPADTPIQVETLDREGRVVRGPSAWIWVRPGELRGCVGCHESRALTPDNRLPIAAGRPAVSLTVGARSADAGGGKPGAGGEADR